MYHYTYLTTRETLDDPMYYIGVRSCKCRPEEDTKYWGSSRLLKQDIAERGTECFSKKIISVFDTRKLANMHEIELHAYYDVGRAVHFYNLARATSEGFNTLGTSRTFGPMSEEHRRNIGNANKGKKRSAEQCQRNGDLKRGRTLSEEHKQKCSNALKGRTLSDEHKNKIRAANTGWVPSAQTRAKWSAQRSGRTKANKEA